MAGARCQALDPRSDRRGAALRDEDYERHLQQFRTKVEMEVLG
jgi:hypothetical protein